MRVTEPYWDDRPVALVGAGSSLRGFDLRVLDGLGCRVVAINNSVYDLPFADAVFSMDTNWIKEHAEFIRGLASAGRTEVYLSALPGRVAAVPGATMLGYRVTMSGLSDDPATIECGYSSGYGGLGLTYLKRAKVVVMLGYDFDGGGHYCEERYTHGRRQHDQWPKWGKHFDTARHQLGGTKVLVANPASNVTAFPRVTLEAGLEALAS